MKLTAIIILAACLQLSAKGYSQTVTLSRTHVSLVTVFEEIQKQTGYNFLYTYEELERVGPVDVDLKNVPLTEAMDRCLRNKALAYSIVEKTVVIKRKEPVSAPEPPVVIAPLPLLDIRGRVIDSLGNPLAGASVTIKGTNKGTKTNARGEFDMKDVRMGTVLVISYTGFNNSELRLVSGVEMYIVSLQRSQDILDATVIQAYGTTSRRFNIGSISTVDAATIEKQPVTNVLLALSGQAPGLAVNSINGVPGSRVLIQIRGQNTISSIPYESSPYDQPLFIVDGVPFSPQNNNISQLGGLSLVQQFGGGISAAGGLSPFNNINPADIETISILKDADATSIYGTQGSNGVILITTKKAKVGAGKGNFNLTANTGFNTAAHQIKLLNREQYLQLRRDAYAADGITPGNDPNNYSSFAPDLTIFDQNKSTDWQHLIFGKSSSNADIHATLSGGSATNSFLISGGYTRTNYNFPGRGFADQRFTIHSAIHHGSQDGKLSIDFGTDYGYDQNNSPGFGGGQKILLAPNTPDLLDSAGNLLWNYKGVDLGNFQFYSFLKMPTLLQNYNLNQSLRIAYHLLPGLTLSANLGYNRNTSSEKSQVPAAAQSPLYVNRQASFATNNYQTINIEPQIDYSITIGRGQLTALAGATYKKNTNNSNQTYGYGYANDLFLGSINGATSVSNFDVTDLYKYSAGFARLKYIYDQKYIISLTGRRDGSSNFGPGHQFGNFASAGAGWIFSEEKPIKTALHFMSYGKLSGSYGTSGSDGIASYKYQSFWTPVGYIPAFQGSQPSVPDNLYNPNYSWALKKSLNLSLDLGFFHDRILLNATYYRNREGNQLGGYPLPIQAGFSSVLQNLPATLQNSGWEFSLTSNNIKTSDLTWTTNFNISFNRNKLLAFPNLESSSYRSRYMVGKPISLVFGYRYKGVNPDNGLMEYYKGDGHTVTTNPQYGLVADGGDQVPIANREVKYMGGIGNNISYAHFSLYIFFQFSSQTAPNYMATVYGSYFPGLSTNNVPVQVLDHWRQPGDHATFGKLTTDYGSETFTSESSFSNSTGAFSDDTYLRLKTLSLSYSLPQNWLKKMHMQDLRIYANAQNLLTFTNYKVADPEQFNDYTNLPLQRTVAFGLSFNF